MEELADLGLSGPNSKVKRLKLVAHYHLWSNALSTIQMGLSILNISKEKVLEVLNNE